MRVTAPVLVFSFTLATAVAQVPTFDISIGVRETGFAGSNVGTIGGNGGATGGIEFINLDGQSLPLDGQWHTFTFNLTTDPVTGFAGTSANSVLEGLYGTFEHVRVKNSSGVTVPITLLFDDFVDTTTTTGPVTITDFEGYGQNSPVMFWQAGFSGSTSGNVLAGSTSGVEQTLSVGSDVLRQDFQFVDNSPTRWVRFTTYNRTAVGNPVIRFDDNSVVTFRMLALTESAADLGSQGPGTATAAMHGSGLNVNEASTIHFAYGPANSIGAVTVSITGLPDVPVLGGNIVSGAGFLFSLPVLTDASGHASLVLGGDPTVVNFALQGVFYDPTQALQFAFTSAVAAGFGQ